MPPNISLRDYPAAMALNGLLALGYFEGDSPYRFSSLASDAYSFADAMLKEKSESVIRKSRTS